MNQNNKLLFGPIFAALTIFIAPIQGSTVRAIIIGAELFHPDDMAMLGNIGFWKTLGNLGIASNAQQKLFDALIKCFGAQTGPIKAYDPKTRAELPQIMVDWMLGTKTPHEIRVLIRSDKFARCFSDSERSFMLKIAEIIFTPDKLGNSMKKASDVVKLMERVAAVRSKDKPALIFAANHDKDTFEVLKASSAGKNVMGLFAKKYTSSKLKVLLQDPLFLTTIMQENNLTPDECLVISEEPHVIQAAQKLGIRKTFELVSVSKLKDYLKAQGLIH